MALTYSTYVPDLANLLVIPVTDAQFMSVLPNIIDDAEQRIYRETDLLATITRDRSGVFVPGTRDFTFPQHFVVSESINFFTPVGTTTYRKPLTPVSREWMDAVYPDDGVGCCGNGFPQYYAMITDQTIIVGPSPGEAYTVEVIGTIRPTPLSAQNPQTYLTQYLPDLFMAASMVFGSAYQMNFSATGDNPQQSATWETHYQALKASAITEELRKHYSSGAWTSKQPSPIATPPRN